MTNVLSDEQAYAYAKTRLCGKTSSGRPVTLDDVARIELHNGKLPSMLLNDLEQRGIADYQRVLQDNGREPIFYSEKEATLFHPQYSGYRRGITRKRMIAKAVELYECDNSRRIAFKVHNPGDMPINAYMNYQNFAYNFVAGLFVREEKHEDRRIFTNIDINGVTKVIFGPTDAIAKQAEVVIDSDNEYIDSQIVTVEGERVLNIGYVYSDQIFHIVSKMLREYGAKAEDKREPARINIYMFGRVGCLDSSLKRHDLICPTTFINEKELMSGRLDEHDMGNGFGSEARIPNLSIRKSILDERIDVLEKARDYGCVSVEMETRDLVAAISQANEWSDDSDNLFDAQMHFVGHVSDRPLELLPDGQRDTLAVELDSDEGEQAAVKKIIWAIRHG